MNKTIRALKIADSAIALAKISTNRADYIRMYDEALAAVREALAEHDVEEMTLTQIASRHEPVKQEPVATDLMDMLRLIETIKYLRGIAERGLGREIREDETIEQFVLGYVKQLEAVQPVKQEPVAFQMVCPRCKVDRVTTQCPNRGGIGNCPMTGTAQNAAPLQPVKQEPVAWQFFEDGKWHNGSDYNCHRQNTEEAGYQIRELYAAPVGAEHFLKAIAALREGIATCRAEALEEAAKVCDTYWDKLEELGEDDYQTGRGRGATDCAAAIRGLK